jgi:hypothetical protein
MLQAVFIEAKFSQSSGPNILFLRDLLIVGPLLIKKFGKVIPWHLIY